MFLISNDCRDYSEVFLVVLRRRQTGSIISGAAQQPPVNLCFPEPLADVRAFRSCTSRLKPSSAALRAAHKPALILEAAPD